MVLRTFENEVFLFEANSDEVLKSLIFRELGCGIGNNLLNVIGKEVFQSTFFFILFLD